MRTTQKMSTWPEGAADTEYVVLQNGVPSEVVSQADCHGELPPAVFAQEEIRRQFGVSVRLGPWEPENAWEELGPDVVVKARVRILELTEEQRARAKAAVDELLGE